MELKWRWIYGKWYGNVLEWNSSSNPDGSLIHHKVGLINKNYLQVIATWTKWKRIENGAHISDFNVGKMQKHLTTDLSKFIEFYPKWKMTLRV